MTSPHQVMAYSRAHGRPAYLFAMNGESCAYNPLASGGYSAKKDRIVELREWTEDHYRKLAEGYLQPGVQGARCLRDRDRSRVRRRPYEPGRA